MVIFGQIKWPLRYLLSLEFLCWIYFSPICFGDMILKIYIQMDKLIKTDWIVIASVAGRNKGNWSVHFLTSHIIHCTNIIYLFLLFKHERCSSFLRSGAVSVDFCSGCARSPASGNYLRRIELDPCFPGYVSTCPVKAQGPFKEKLFQNSALTYQGFHVFSLRQPWASSASTEFHISGWSDYCQGALCRRPECILTPYLVMSFGHWVWLWWDERTRVFR